MTSDWVQAIVHVVLLGCVAVYVIRSGRPLRLLFVAPAAVAGYSLWWMAGFEPTDAPAWLLVIMVAGYAGATIATAWVTRTPARSAGSHLALTIAGGMLSLAPSALLAFLVWGLVTAR